MVFWSHFTAFFFCMESIKKNWDSANEMHGVFYGTYDKVWDVVIIWLPREPNFGVKFFPQQKVHILPSHAYI